MVWGVKTSAILMFFSAFLAVRGGSFTRRTSTKTKDDKSLQETYFKTRKRLLPANFVIRDCAVGEACSALFSWYQKKLSPEDCCFNLTVLPGRPTNRAGLNIDGEVDPFAGPLKGNRVVRTVDLSGLSFEAAVEKIASAFNHVVVLRDFRFLVLPEEEQMECFAWRDDEEEAPSLGSSRFTEIKLFVPERFVIRDCSIWNAYLILYAWYGKSSFRKDPYCRLTVFPKHQLDAHKSNATESDNPFTKPLYKKHLVRSMDLSGLSIHAAIEKIATAFDYVAVRRGPRFFIVPKEELDDYRKVWGNHR